MTIRQAEAEDLSQIAVLLVETQDLHVAAYPEIYKPVDRDVAETYLRQQRTRPDVLLLVAADNTLVTGYCLADHRAFKENLFSFERRITYINQVAVRQDHRRKGIAESLIMEVVGVARARGDQWVELDVWSFNNDAKTAFQKVGFDDFGSKMQLNLRTTY